MCTHKLSMYMLYTYILYKCSRSSEVQPIADRVAQNLEIIQKTINLSFITWY